MRTRYVTWEESVELFRARGVPQSTFENLYEETYILVSGAAAVTGELPLDDHDRTPWSDGETPDNATGYIIDGDLTVEGNLVSIDDGSAALVVLGNLRAEDVYLEGDAKLIVMGDVTSHAFVGDMTDKLVMIHGDLRARVALFWDEFCPDLVTGTIHGRVLAPEYLDLETDIGGLVDPTPEIPLDALLVPELLITDTPGERDFKEIGVRGATLRERIIDGLPLTKAV